jgi:hypothetical protein
MSFLSFNNVGGYSNPPPPPLLEKTFYGITAQFADVDIDKPEYGPYTLLTNSNDSFTIEFFYKNNVDVDADYGVKYIYMYNNANNIFLELKLDYTTYKSVARANRLNMSASADSGTATINKASLRYNDFLGTSTSTKNWHHVAITYDGTAGHTSIPATNTKLYIDGTFIPIIGTASQITEYTYFYSRSTSGTYLRNTFIGTPLTLRIMYYSSYQSRKYLVNPVYNLRITKKVVYNGNFTVPTKVIYEPSILKKTQPSSTNISAINEGECILCIESYKDSTGATVIRDSVDLPTGINSGLLSLNNRYKICTFNTVEQVYP